jgi:Kef-type K+ transport system membrane component KefB
MFRAKQQSRFGQFAWAMVVMCTVAFVLMLSIATASSLGHAFDQVTLALPVYFVLLFLAVLIVGWLQLEGFFLEPKPRLSASLTRGPPVKLSFRHP